MPAPVSKLSLFAILLLSSARALATEPAPPPVIGAMGGVECKDTLVSVSPCLSYISASPNNESSIAPPECCDAFSSIFNAGKVFCLCYFLKEDLLFGFPIDSSRLLSLSSVCLPPNVTSPGSVTSKELNCSVLQALSPLGSAGFEPLYPPIAGHVASPPSIASASDNSPTSPNPTPDSDSEYPQTSCATKLRITFKGLKNCLVLIQKGNPVSITQTPKQTKKFTRQESK